MGTCTTSALKLDNAYNPTMKKLHEPIIKVKYKVTRETRFIQIIVEHEEDGIQWACNTSISTDTGEYETLREAISRPIGHLWKISAVS